SPYGNNMAFTKAMFEKHGLFRTELGPQPGSKIRDEDTEFGLRVLAGGDRICYEPTAVLYHAVPPERRRKDYFLSWWLDEARAEIRLGGVRRDAKWQLMGVPSYFFRRIVRWSLAWLLSVNPAHRFYCRTRVWWLAGAIRECYYQSADSKSHPAGAGSTNRVM